MRALALVLPLAMVLVACETDRPQPSTPLQQPIEYKDSIVLQREHGCSGAVDQCSSVDVTFQVFSGTNRVLVRSLNRAVRNYFVDVLGGAPQPQVAISDTSTPMPSIMDASRLLLGDFTEFKERYPQARQVWTVHGMSKVTAFDSLICVELHVESYTGGAHGNTNTSYIVADVRSGKQIAVTSLVKNIQRFTDSAERAFRVQTGIGLTEELGAHNYFVEDSTFGLPENIGLTADSIVLYYNEYEIAPYVMGPTRITMPRSALKVE